MRSAEHGCQSRHEHAVNSLDASYVPPGAIGSSSHAHCHKLCKVVQQEVHTNMVESQRPV